MDKGLIKKNNWYIFENSTFSNINISDCNDTISGICETSKSLDECIDKCRGSENCKYGYYIETPKENICVPLILNNETTTPYYRIRNKNIYPELKKLHSTVFVNDIYPFPPNMANVIFFTDNFELASTTGYNLSSLDDDKTVFFSKGSPITIRFLPEEVKRTYVEEYIPVRDGDTVILNIPNTGYVFHKKLDGDIISWILRASDSKTPNSFMVHGKGKTTGDILTYSDTIYFMYNNNPLVLKEDSLVISEKNLDKTLEDGESMYFNTKPNVKVYYHNGNSCKEVNLDETEREGEQAHFMGNIVGRSSSCFGMEDKPKNYLQIVLVCFLVLITIYLFYKIVLNSNHK